MLIAAGLPFSVQAKEFPGLTGQGPSGMVLVPTGQTLKANWWAVGMQHGIPTASYGVLGIGEVGLNFPDILEQPTLEEAVTGTRWFAKVAVEPPSGWWWAPGLAAGAENRVGQGLVRFVLNKDDVLALPDETYYACGSWGWDPAGWPLEATVGTGSGRFIRKMFGGVGFIPRTIFGDTLKVVAEYAGLQAVAGTRLALSRTLRLDFSMLMDATPPDLAADGKWLIKIHGGLVGVSQTNPLNLDWLKRKKKPVEAAPKREDGPPAGSTPG